jgi:hypothetical protein
MKYKDYVRSLPCCVTGTIGDCVSPHHIIGNSWLTGKAMSKKAPDSTCIPLRQDIHQELHDMGWRSFENKYNICQLEMMIKTILQAEKDGIVKF